MYSFPNLEPVCCSMSGFNCCFLTCIQISQEICTPIWYSHLLKNCPQRLLRLADFTVTSPFLSWLWLIPGWAEFQCQLAFPRMIHWHSILQVPSRLRTSFRCLCSWTCSSLAIYLPAASPKENPMPWVLVLPFIPEDGLRASNAWAAWWPVSTVWGAGTWWEDQSAIIWSGELWLPISV